MKKYFITLLLCVVCIGAALAQIGELTPKQEKLEIKRALKNVSLVHDKEENTYALMIESDNSYEDKYALLMLGTGEQESLNSLVNLNKALQGPQQSFEVQGYTISTMERTNDKKHYGIVQTMGPLQYAAGTYIFEEEGLSNAMLVLIAKMIDFDFSNAVVTTKKIWGSPQSAVGITDIMCDIYIPQLSTHFVGGIGKYNRQTDTKKFTKKILGLTKTDMQWETEQYRIVVNGIDDKLFKIEQPFFEKICRLKAQ